MNRPFYAFGVLMAFLVLAMLAVAVTSRPTTGRPTAGSSGTQTPDRTSRGGLFVCILPEDDAAQAADYQNYDCSMAVSVQGASDLPSYDTGCGLDRGTGLVYSVGGELRGAVATALVPGGSMQAAQIRLARQVPAVGDGPFEGDLGYDPAYDVAMGLMVAAPDPAPAAQSTAGTLDGEELLGLFQSLQQAGAPASSPSGRAARGWELQARTMLAGVANRLWQQLEVVKLADDWQRAAARVGAAPQEATPGPAPLWSDYLDWVTSQGGVAILNTQVTKDASLAQRTGRPMMQFAAAGLNHVAEMLRASADWLEEASSDRVAQQRSSVWESK